jgi:hypothetical protein
VVPIGRPASSSNVDGVGQSLVDLTAGDLRRASDGWHAVLRIRGAEHRLWLAEPPTMSMSYTAVLPLDSDFEVRAHAARRLWRAINGRALGPAFHELSPQRRERVVLAVRALDGRMDGGTYRAVAEVLFGKKRIPERAWKTHDLRNRTIRLVQSGFALMRGGYRELIRYRGKQK